MSLKRVLYIITVLLLVGVVGLVGAMAGGYAVYRVMSAKLGVEQSTTMSGANTVASGKERQYFIDSTNIETTITRAVKSVAPAVVTVVGTVPGQMTFFGLTGDQTVSGSGVFITADGYILTNNHVVEGTTSVSIVLQDGEQQDARIVGTDKYADLAVLKTESKVPAFAPLGNSDLLDPGETVIAIGSPLGEFKNSVTVGVISAMDRAIDTGNGYSIENLLQTDAAINQGNSGGPLVNLAGEIIGINTLIVRSSESGTVAEGLGFAIESNTVQAISAQIIEKGYFSRPYLGVQVQEINPYIASRYQLPVEWGSYVTRVVTGSPGEEAGIREGDIIIRMGDFDLDETHNYLNTLYEFQAGEKLTIILNRNGDNQTVEVTLGETKGQ